MYHQPHSGALPHYGWGYGNGWRLRHFFIGVRPPIVPVHRHHFYVGGFLPFIYLPEMQPIPYELMGYLPPVPDGYEIGYFDGYGIVYHAQTLQIIGLIDLYR